MVLDTQLDELERESNAYAAQAGKISFEIENRQEELEGILRAYQGMNDASAQVLRHYFLNGGELK